MFSFRSHCKMNECNLFSSVLTSTLIVNAMDQSCLYISFCFQLQKENTEDYIEYLKSIDWLDEAAKRLVNIIDDDSYISKEGKSKHQV